MSTTTLNAPTSAPTTAPASAAAPSSTSARPWTPAAPAGAPGDSRGHGCGTVMPVATLNHIQAQRRHTGTRLNRAVLEFYGVFVIEGLLAGCIERYQAALTAFKTSGRYQRTASHLTEVKLALDEALCGILDEPVFCHLAEQLFPEGAGLYGIRLVKKDATDRKPVFLHQDIGYHHGTDRRYSLFVPLTRCCAENGGLEFIPGTHHFGHLGDAGEINPQAVPPQLQTLIPTVMPGDVVVMHSALWHRSGPNASGSERICYDIHINTLDDPATVRGLGGRRPHDTWQLDYTPERLFTNSRSQRLRRLYEREEQAAAKG